jgi:hypothetical protein
MNAEAARIIAKGLDGNPKYIGGHSWGFRVIRGESIHPHQLSWAAIVRAP